jgi:predicted nuclease with TOPRIM domain
MKEVFSVAAAILASIGGAGAILLGLSNWLGKIWSSRVIEREKAELTKSIERVKAELQESNERVKAELQSISSQRQDALNRKRDVYSDLATNLRVLLKGGNLSQEEDKRAFLRAYDKGYIWASEPLVLALRDLMETLVAKAAIDTQITSIVGSQLTANPNAQTVGVPEALLAETQKLDSEAQKRYQNCMLEMRKDCGFPDTRCEQPLVTFGS